MKNDTNFRLVYSTELGQICPYCNKSVSQCTCKTPKTGIKQDGIKRDGIIRVGRETKGRKGKGVSTITGLPLTLDQIHNLAKQLKQKCGSGGTVKEGIVEIQGDHRDTIIDELTKLGYPVKRSGG